MARKSKKRKVAKTKKLITSILALIVIIVAGIMYLNDEQSSKPVDLDGDTVRVHIIDVGQGDCTVFETASGNIIFDAGTNESEDELRAYLNNNNLKSFKYAIFTHPHADHIGGADMVINEFDVENVIIPDVETGTKTFEYFMDAIEKKSVNTILAESGKNYSVGNLNIKILAPNSKSYTEDNNYSIVAKAQFGNKTFMLTGDAEEQSEEEIIEKYGISNLKCDFLKVGHHGAANASSEAFINAVRPSIATISCGKGNDYGHPHAETLSKLNTVGATVYRTDELGSIVFECDGNTIVKK